jgi:CHAT domain-containing protein
MFSKLAFAASKDSLEDGFLNAYELYNMNISAKMVVLSACETGYGKLEKGEGIMSLAHGFTYAGCPSVVMSHWVADDQATAQLMELFYKHINQGMAKDEALQKAKIDFIERADNIRQNPAFWAAFVVLGDAQPLTKSFLERYWIRIVMLSFVALVSLIFLVKRGRKRQRY